MPSPSPNGRVGLLVGVTGHRAIRPDGVDRVRQSVEAVLRELKADFGAKMPIAVMSSLAAGADQIAADAALQLGLRVVAVLPRAREHLEVDDPIAQAGLVKILDNPSTQVLDLWKFDEIDTDLSRAPAATTPEALDELRYELSGLLITRHAHVMLALVESKDIAAVKDAVGRAGVVQGPIGGVRRILASWLDGRLTGGAMGATPLVRPDPLLKPFPTGPLIHVATPRGTDQGVAEMDFGQINVLLPGAEMNVALQRRLAALFGQDTDIWRRLTGLKVSEPASVADRRAPVPALQSIGRFNDTAGLSRASLDRACDASERNLLPDGGGRMIGFGGPETQRDAAIAACKSLFGRADGLANDFQSQLKIWTALLLAAVPLSVFVIELFGEIYPQGWVLLLYVAIFGVAVLSYVILDISNMQSWYQDCRLIGEGARVQFYWALAGMARSVAEEHRTNELGDGSWLHAAIKWVSLQGLIMAQTCREHESAIRYWVGDPVGLSGTLPKYVYRRWYTEASHREETRFKAMGRLRAALFAVSYGIAGVAASALLLSGRAPPETAKAAIMLSAPTLGAIGGVVGLWRERRVYEQHIHEYARMRLIVGEAARRLNASNDRAMQMACLYAVGQAALTEASRWLFAHRSQPVYPIPTAG